MGFMKPSNKPAAAAQAEAERQRQLDEEQKKELAKQKGLAEDAQALSMQGSLDQDTNKIKRLYGAKTLLNSNARAA